MRPDNIEDIYPLSPVQQGILFHTLYAPEAGEYFRQLVFAVDGDLDEEAFARTWQEVVDRHSILRTAFVWEEGDEPVQVVCRRVEIPLERWDRCSLEPAEQERCVVDYLREDRRRGMELSEAPLMRLALFRLADRSYRFVWSYHHLLLDGWSVALLVRRVFAVYRALTHGDRVQLERVRPYRDFIAWLKAQDRSRAESFWRLALAGFRAPTPLPLELAVAGAERQTEDRLLALSAEATAALQVTARAHGVTLNTVLQGAWALLLGRYSGEPEVVFGATASGRPTDLPGFESMVGLFINTLPVRVPVPAEADLCDWLRRLQASQVEARQFEYSALVDVIRWSDLPRGQPLFESIVVFENYRLDEAMPERDSQLEVRRLDLVDGTSYPLTLIVRPEAGLVLRLLYEGSRCGEPEALRLLGHMGTLLEGFASAPARPLSGFSLLTAAEQQQIVVEWNATETSDHSDLCLHELFSAQARRSGDALALVCEERTLTYRDLDRRSAQLAHHLLALGAGPETRVGLCLERSLEMVVALLGVLKCGAAYVPIDPSYPLPRQAWMLEDSAVPVVLTLQRMLPSIPATAARILPLDSGWEPIAAQPEEDPRVPLADENLAYVIYTSGSTGRPKGAMNTHRAVRNRILWMQESYRLDASDRVLQKTPSSFDVSVWELFWPLLTGARLILARPEGHRDPSYLAGLIREQGVTTLHFVPPMLQVFLQEPAVAECRSLRRVICSGEALPAELERRFFAGFDAELHNLYGPTEAAVDVTSWACERGGSRRSIPIGRPIANLRIHLLDCHLQSAAVGTPGELHIGGVGLARGYLHRPDLTAEKFVPDPLATAPGERLYKTGDLARALPDGALEFLGRIDHQVKIRGFRIELGEIEAELAAHPAVHEAVVLARDDDGAGKRLVAYVVSDREATPGELRAFLQTSLPEHMVPAVFIALPALPLGPNGKLDRAALPAPGGTRLDSGRPFVAPRSAAERDLAEIWQEVLRVARVGIDDGFFELGGDSIRSIQVLARARTRGLSLTLPQLFRYPTIRELAPWVEEGTGEELPALEPFSLIADDDRTRLPAGVVDAYPLALLQAGMLFHSEMRPDSAIYHDVFSYHFEARLEAESLRHALRQLLARHPVLRTSFHLTGFSEPLQLVHAEVGPPLEIEDLRSLPIGAQQEAVDAWIEREKRTRLLWSRPPLLRFQVHVRSGGAFQLTLSFHHAILDGWSIAAMLTELFQAYLRELGLSDAPLAPPPTVAFRQFVALERAAVASEESRRFWLETLEGCSFLALPRWRPRLAAGLRMRRVPIPEEVSEELGRLAAAAAVPLKSVLLASHLRVLALVGGQTGPWDVVTGLVTNGRPEVADGDRVLGLFLNTLPLRLRSRGGAWIDLVRETFEAEREILAHRRFPISELQRLLGNRPLFEIAFNYVHFHVRESLSRVAGVQALGGASYEETNFALLVNFRLRPSSTALELDLRYDAAELADEQVEALAGYFARTLAAMAGEPLARCEVSQLLSEAECHQLHSEWNDSVTAALDVPLHHLVEAQVERTPESVALIFAERSLTYAELNVRANRLAHRLRREGVGPDVPVAICVERSPEMVIGALAVLKAGGVYVPLDPSHPRHRLELVLEDLGWPLLLTMGSVADDLAPRSRRTLRLDELPEDDEGSNPAEWATLDDLSYILFTSGSTGRPKGVGISHRSFVNLLGAMSRRPGLAESDVLLAVTTFSFDIAGLEVFLPLIMGAGVLIAERESVIDGEALIRLLGGATVLQATPATWRLLLESGWQGCPGLVMMSGGEALPRDLADRLLERGRHLWNLYGPTETTVYSIGGRVEAGPGPVTIGVPIDNTEAHLLDGFLQPVPIGVPAELWIAGEGLARGYFRQPGPTAENFLPHPFAPRPGARIYRTGDLARRLPDGRVEHLGRIDHQVKVRGFRIEPGEIEAVLLQHAAVRQALAVLRKDAADSYLVAYVVAENLPSLASELRDLLRARLPEYMLPKVVMRLEALPLTPSGKVDRRALPPPDEIGREVSQDFVAPRAPIEELLAGIWSDVLGRERVGAHDDFFALGGHSLSATRVVARIRDTFAVDLPLRELFDVPVLSTLAVRLAGLMREGAAFDAAPQVPISREGGLVLSFGQERLWFLDQLEPESSAYNIPLAIRLEGTLDPGALGRAFATVVGRHEALRAIFPSRDGQPTLIVGPPWPPAIPLVDLAGIADAGRERELRRIARQEHRQPFDLAAGPPLRVRLLRLGESEHVLLATVHHIVSDAWSMGLLVWELSELYTAFAADRLSPLPDLAIQYADFARWQRRVLQGDALEVDLAYWRDRLTPPPAGLDLPVDRPHPAVASSRGSREPFPISPQLAAKLRRVSRREGVSVFMLLLAAFQTLLHRYSGQVDLAVGTPIAGRTRVEVEGLIGLFINTLVLRCDLADDPSFTALLDQVREVCLDAHEHQHLPFERLVEALQPARTLMQPPFFQVMLVLQNAPRTAVEPPGLRLSGLGLGSEAAKFDLTLTVSDDGAGLGGSLLYRAELWDRPTIVRLLGHLETLLAGAVDEPGRSLSALPLLREIERAQILTEWNDGALTRPAVPFFHRIFEAQARNRPDADALAFEEERWSYAELNRRANRLARVLRARGVGPEVAVGLCLERSATAILGMLAVFKAGGACVPLDPALPAGRLAMMLEESRAVWIVTESRRLATLEGRGRERALCLDELAGEIAAESGEDLDLPLAEENLAYVLFTSGSTGRSKGVAVEHRQLLHYVRAVAQRLALEPGMSFATVSTLSADLGHTAIFPTLSLGGCLYVVSEARVADADRLAEYLDHHPVDGLKIVPSHLAALHGSLAEPARLLPRRRLVLGGEASFHDEVARLQELDPELAIFNHYGPTETTVGVLACRFDPGERRPSSAVPLGRPLAGVRIRVLDRHRQPVPIGVPGELCVAGPSVSRGYLHRPELTAERFLPDPFGAPGGRLYKTGDLARYLPDGQLEFLGRNDDQVKCRGFRVELGEIAAALKEHPGLREAVVVLRKEPAAQLVAYGVPRAEGAPMEAELRAFLRQRLPEHMIPNAFLLLPGLPLTPNGKVDQMALPAPDRGGIGVAEDRLAPRTFTEEILAAFWGELLGIEGIAVRDNFFDLGGHSLLATRLISRVRRAFEVELPLRALFERPTIEELAASIEVARNIRGPEVPTLRVVPRGSDLPLSFAQERLWLIAQREPDSPAYNVPSSMRLLGRLDVSAMRHALSEVVHRHEALRTRFVTLRGEPRQIVSPPVPVPLPVVDLGALSEPERGSEAQRLAALEARRPFDLECGPLLRAGLIRLGEAEHVALLTLHHIVCDAWSRGILLREIIAFYAGAVQAIPPTLPALQVQYGDFACWQRSWLTGERLEAEISYWREQLAGAPRTLELPADRPPPAVQSFRGASLPLALPAELSAELEALGRRQGATLFMTLLAAFQLLLSRYSHQEDVSVGTPVGGRARIELEGLIGFFVNTLVLRTDLSGDPSFSELLARVRKVALEAQDHQSLPFERVVEEHELPGSSGNSPLFRVMFVLQNAPREEPNLPGLTLQPLAAETGTAKFDLMLVMAQRPGGLRGMIEYSSDLFDRSTILRMAQHLELLLSAAAADCDRPLSTLPAMTMAERQQLLIEWNDTSTGYPRDLCLHELFAFQAARAPEEVAVVCGGEQLSYGDLDRRSARLARCLGALGVGAEERVGLWAERSPELIVALLGILRAGGAYLPLAPEYPRERLAWMLDDAGATVLLAERRLFARLADASPREGLRVIFLDELEAGEEPAADLPQVDPANLAYVMYTSGSTGLPKGVAVTHRNVMRLVRGADYAEMGPEQVWLQYAPMSFDASTLEIWAPLLNGGRLVLVPGSQAALDELAGAIREHGVTSLWLTAGLFHQMVDERPAGLRPLTQLLTGGDVVSSVHARRLLELLPGLTLIDGYGPTEGTTFTSCHRMTEPWQVGAVVPIGRPIANGQVYLLDASFRPVPVGIVGELCAAGTGLARGYLDRPELTAERFVPDPFGESGGRMYRTGDVARFLPGGEIEFVGRSDHQVKIRGYRVEPGEVETALALHPSVQNAVVLVHRDGGGESFLAAYVVLEAGIDDGAATEELRRFLRQSLPEPMIPSAFVFLDALPLTSNGKVDRRALLELDLAGKAGSAYVAPRTPDEEALVRIWAEVLRAERIGVTDNFLELGGHSLRATQVVVRVRDTLGVDLPLRTFFENPTIEQLAAALVTLRSASEDQVLRSAIEELDGLSDEEVRLLLGEQRQLAEARSGHD